MIIPVILEPTLENIKKRISQIEEVAPQVQIDVADGKLVNGKTYLKIKNFSKLNTKCDITMHLMVKNPNRYILSNKKSLFSPSMKIPNMSTVITQLVEKKTMKKFIENAKWLGYKIGISINSDQPVSAIYPYIKDINYVQFMGVIPGHQGSQFIPEVLDKIRAFKKEFLTVPTLIDGGVKEDNIPIVAQTGVDNIVIGSAIFNSVNPKEKYLELTQAAYGQTNNS